MPLIRTLVVLLAVSGCSESLFGTHGGGHGSGGIPDQCSAPCLADAAANFDGTMDGGNDRWGYLDDNRDRTWTPMTPTGMAMVGTVNNRIERCADQPSAAACAGLSDALLVTSSGTSSKADPALLYTAAKAQVMQLVLHVNVPQGSATHRVRLYRNSREDVLFTTTAAPGDMVAHEITVDALEGDRFLVALEPIDAQGGTAALQFSFIDTHQTFPSTCQLALTFADSTVVSSTVANLCGAANAGFTYIYDTTPGPPVIDMGPYKEEGDALYFEPTVYLAGSKPLGGDSERTIQFWVKNDAPTQQLAWVFSDVDETSAHGLAIRFTNMSGASSGFQLEAAVVNATNPVAYVSQGIAIPNLNPLPWNFVRVVHAGGNVTLCLNGTLVKSAPLPGPIPSDHLPVFGQNGSDTSTDLSGDLDDVRVFSGTLPCNE